MFKSRDVSKEEHSNFCSIWDILGIAYGFLFNSAFSFLKYDMNLTAMFFFGIINIGTPNSQSLYLLITPRLTSLSILTLRVSWWILGTGKALP
jgi:hypothetical protein